MKKPYQSSINIKQLVISAGVIAPVAFSWLYSTELQSNPSPNTNYTYRTSSVTLGDARQAVHTSGTVTPSEHTREIGLRMAVGARRTDISFHFLIEATVSGLIGGLFGVAVGIAGTTAIANNAIWPILITPSVILLAFFASGLVGAVFGFLPAQRASQLNPIDALRTE